MTTVNDVLKKLKAKTRADQLEGMAAYRMRVEKRLGVAVPEMRKMAKEIENTVSKSAQWIASDAIRDLTSDATKRRLNRKKG